MSDALIAFFRKPDDRAREVVLVVDDGGSDAPPAATAYPCAFDAMLVTSGLRFDMAPKPGAAFAAARSVIEARAHGRDGARSDGFAIARPSVRTPVLTHSQFDAHWHDEPLPHPRRVEALNWMRDRLRRGRVSPDRARVTAPERAIWRVVRLGGSPSGRCAVGRPSVALKWHV